MAETDASKPVTLSRDDEYILWVALCALDDDHTPMDNLNDNQFRHADKLRTMLHDRMFTQPAKAR